MKRYIVFVLFMSLSVSGFAQNYRRWNEGPVKWSDFTKVDRKVDDLDLNIVVSFQKRDTLVSTEKLNYRYTIVDAAINDWSWVYSGSMNDRTLAYAQTYFDIAQSYARSYMDSLMFNSGNVKELETRFYKRLRAAEDEFHKNGTISMPVSLGQDVDITRINYTRSKLANSFGGYVMAGLPLTYLDDIFSGMVGAGVEVDLQYQRFHTIFDIGAGICMINKNNYLNLVIANDSTPTYASFMIRPGFELTTPGSRFKLTIFTGGGSQVYWFAKRKKLEAPREITSAAGFAISEGIKGSLQLNKTLIDFCDRSSTESFQSLNVRVWSDQVLLHGALAPAAFLSIGYSASFRPLTRAR